MSVWEREERERRERERETERERVKERERKRERETHRDIRGWCVELIIVHGMANSAVTLGFDLHVLMG